MKWTDSLRDMGAVSEGMSSRVRLYGKSDEMTEAVN